MEVTALHGSSLLNQINHIKQTNQRERERIEPSPKEANAKWYLPTKGSECINQRKELKSKKIFIVIAIK